MSQPKPIVRRPGEMPAPDEAQTEGVERRELLDDRDRWVGWSRTTPGMASGWHHHGDRDTYVFMTRGSITFEFGPGGRESVTCSTGDFALMPARAVHREITEPGEPAEAFVVRVGSGPPTVNVDGPDPVVA